MVRISPVVLFACLLLAMSLPAAAQFTTPDQANKQATPVDIPQNAPDMVCFGESPDWSIQFRQAEARNVGISERNWYYTGKFVWVPDLKVWEWEGQNSNGNGQRISATIKQTKCVDQQRKQQFPWSAQVNLPEGDIVNGCCRKLKPGEAAVGDHGYISPNKQ